MICWLSKRHVLKLGNNNIWQLEAVGLSKGLKDINKEAKGLQRELKAPQQLSARARFFRSMRQNILVII